MPNLMLISQRTPRTKPKNTNAEPCESQSADCAIEVRSKSGASTSGATTNDPMIATMPIATAPTPAILPNFDPTKFCEHPSLLLDIASHSAKISSFPLSGLAMREGSPQSQMTVLGKPHRSDQLGCERQQWAERDVKAIRSSLHPEG